MSRQEISLADNGKSIAAAPGDELIIALPEKATAGYQWEVSEAPSGVDVAMERPPSSQGAAPGADALTLVLVRVRAPVRGRIVLAHRQPWDQTSPGSSKFHIELRTP